MRRRKRGIFTKLCIAVFAIYAALTLLTLQSQINERRNTGGEMARQLLYEQQKNARLKAATESEWDDDMIRSIARERLGLVDEGEELYVDVSN